jgi:hypothetical protein
MKKGKVVPKSERRKTEMKHADIVSAAIIEGCNEAMDALDKHGGMTGNDLMNGIYIAAEITLTQMAKALEPANWQAVRSDMLRIVAGELTRCADTPRDENGMARD